MSAITSSTGAENYSVKVSRGVLRAIIQRRVAEAVSNLVGMPVREVNVYVQDAR